MGSKTIKKYGELRIHIGAHKTATTHLQDTLNEIRTELLEYKINYIPRHTGRPRLLKATPWGIARLKYKLLFGFQKRKLLITGLFPDSPLDETIILSEENILGSILDELSTRPYQNIDRKLAFIKQLSKDFSVKIFFSIRSFNDVLPGAYVTALRFRPKEAVLAKAKLLSDLDNGERPSWVEVIKRLKSVLPTTEIKIWTQEDYRNHSDQIICQFLGKKIKNIPTILSPRETITPSCDAISQIENMIQGFETMPTNWQAMCDQIYASKPAKKNSEKYTFLDETLKEQLQKSYEDDLIELRKFLSAGLIEV